MSAGWAPTKGPKTKRLAEARLRQLLFLASCEDDTAFLERARRAIPEAWKTLELDIETTAPKEKVTLYLDRSVARMFRAMGGGYQARINRVLETYVQLKIAEHVALEIDMLEAIAKAAEDRRRPEEGSTELDGRRLALHEHWAYAQGIMDMGIRPEPPDAEAPETG